MINYISIIPIICDLCSKKVEGYYAKGGEWWDKYVDSDQQICFDCIKGKEGFAEDFKKNVKISLIEYEKIKTHK